jgi:predicted HicB family RNase H-like nuclease
VGGESDTLVRGTDPDLRFRVRSAGYRVVMVPHTWGYHPQPKTLKELLRMWFKQGAGAAQVFLTEPEMVIDTPDAFEEGESYRRPFTRRVVDSIGRIASAAARAQEISLLCQVAYVAGYLSHAVDRKVSPAKAR